MPRLLPFTGLLVVALMSLSACDSDTPTTPTPAPSPAPTPAPTPTPTPTPTPPTPSAPAALESITLSASTVIGQQQPTATIRLTAAAPAGNAQISLDSTNETVVKVPANVSVAAGQTTNTFLVDTSTVRTSTDVTINARYAGVSMSATLTVLPPTLEAQFRVTSTSRGDDSCVIVSSAGAVDCVFDASRSTGFPSQYRWTLSVAGKEQVITLGESQVSFTPGTDCGFLGGGTLSEGEVPMLVSLQVRDRQGNTSTTTQRTIDLVPNGMCGY